MVDINPDIQTSLNYNLSDITEPNSIKSSFSKTIKLLDTPNNRLIFSDISDLNSELDFNPNLKIKAWILVDTIVNFEGYLQIKQYTVRDGFGEYDAVIYSDLDNIFKSIGDSMLNEIDLTDLDHNYDLTTITASWTDDTGYLYPLVDYGFNWTTTNLTNPSQGIVYDSANDSPFKPSIKSKIIFDRIFANAGYTYESDLINSDQFNSLFELYPMQLSADLIDRYVFTAGLNGDVNISKTQSLTGVHQYGWDNNNVGDYLRFPNEVSPNGDPDSQWDGYRFIPIRPFTTSDYLYTDFELWILSPSNYVSDFNTNNANRYRSDTKYGSMTMVKNNQIINNVSFGITASVGPGYPNGVNIQGTQDNWNGHNGTTFHWPQYLGATTSGTFSYLIYRIRSRTDFASPNNAVPLLANYDQFTWQINTNFSTTLLAMVGTATPLFIIKETQSNGLPSLVYNKIATSFTSGAPVSMSNLLPRNIKQKDWLISIIKMFNLILEPSKEIPNHIVIKTRDEFYSAGEIKDWSDKLDASQDLNGKVLGDTQNKKFIYTYKQDKDYLNEKYLSKTNQSYGSYEADIDNDFVNGVSKIELLHSATPIANVPSTPPLFTIPSIYSLEDTNTANQQQASFNPRILYYNGLVEANSTYYLRRTNQATGISFSYYPQLSHYSDNFDDDAIDLNFGQCPLGYFDNRTETNNNLFERYHKTQFNQLTDQDSRIITVDLLLDAHDIDTFKFNDRIFIDQNFYYVNSISDYDPGRLGTSKVELIKVNTTVDAPTARKFSGETNLNIPKKSILDIGYANQYSADTNRIITAGENNQISGSNIFVIGNNNYIGYTVSSTASEPGTYSISNTFIIGDNITVTQSNTTYISGNIVMDGTVTITGTTSIPSLTLSDVLANGNNSNGYGIVMGTTSQITGSNGGAYLDLTGDICELSTNNGNALLNVQEGYTSLADWSTGGYAELATNGGYLKLTDGTGFSTYYGVLQADIEYLSVKVQNASAYPNATGILIGKVNSNTLTTAAALENIGVIINSFKSDIGSGSIGSTIISTFGSSITGEFSAIIGGVSNLITNVSNTVVLGGSSIAATQSNMVYVPSLYLNSGVAYNVSGVYGVSDSTKIEMGFEQVLLTGKADVLIVGTAGSSYPVHYNTLTQTNSAAATTTLGTVSISNNQVLSIEAVVNAYSSGTNVGYAAKLYAVFKKQGGTCTQIGTTDVTAKDGFADGTAATIDTDGTIVRIRVTNGAGLSTVWSARYEYQT